MLSFRVPRQYNSCYFPRLILFLDRFLLVPLSFAPAHKPSVSPLFPFTPVCFFSPCSPAWISSPLALPLPRSVFVSLSGPDISLALKPLPKPCPRLPPPICLPRTLSGPTSFARLPLSPLARCLLLPIELRIAQRRISYSIFPVLPTPLNPLFSNLVPVLVPVVSCLVPCELRKFQSHDDLSSRHFFPC